MRERVRNGAISMTQKVQIIIDGKTSELPVLQATMGLNVVDVRGLISEGI